MVAYSSDFIDISNFRLAFERILHSNNFFYKSFYRNALGLYSLSLNQNLKSLIKELKDETYEPSLSTTEFVPKQNGILRPFAVLTLKDLIVYQALGNTLAVKLSSELKARTYDRTFGNVYSGVFSGHNSPYYFVNWRKSYRRFQNSLISEYNQRKVFWANFDLASFYEVIDHSVLKNYYSKKIVDIEILDLLIKCLGKWSNNKSGLGLAHGIPQGPEASSFLGECYMFYFDDKQLPGVSYFRYVDDIRLLAYTESDARRGLTILDLASKELGLIPQAQKIQVSKVDNLDNALSRIPSGVLNIPRNQALNFDKRIKLKSLLTSGIKTANSSVEVLDNAKFRYALYRLPRDDDVLSNIAKLMLTRPDLSSDFSQYLQRAYPQDKKATDIIVDALTLDPVFDYAVSNYVQALRVCNTGVEAYDYSKILGDVLSRSVEKSPTLKALITSFLSFNYSFTDKINVVKQEPNIPVRRKLFYDLILEDSHIDSLSTHEFKKCKVFESDVKSEDEELARAVAYFFVIHNPLWKPPPRANSSVRLLMVGLGLKSRTRVTVSTIDRFFALNCGFAGKIPWKKALGSDFYNVRRSCMKIPDLRLSHPAGFVNRLDTFNESLIRSLSVNHSFLNKHYHEAGKGTQGIPKYGAWLNNSHLVKIIPFGVFWFKKVHNARTDSLLSHSRSVGGKRKGKPTREIGSKEANVLMKGASSAWKELLTELEHELK